MSAPISTSLIDLFRDVVGEAHLATDPESLFHYSHDQTEDLSFLPDIVLRPDSATQISQILKICNEYHIPVTPRGAGTGLSGGALPVQRGVLLSTERLNRILHIDEQNLQVSVEPGVVTQVLQEAVIEKGLYYPPDPSSRGSCFIGGNLAESSGGPRAVKYGVTKDYVLNLEVVLPTGEIIWTGANVLKNATGYNLTQLMIGSEGTLGIITKAVLKLIPYPTQNVVMLVPFRAAEQACAAVAAIFHAGLLPSALEFMEREAIEWSRHYLTHTMGMSLSIPLGEEDAAHLLIEVDGDDMELLYRQAERITQVLEKFDIGEIYFGDTPAQKDELWRMRRNAAHAVRANSIFKEEDTVVPRAALPQLLRGVKEIGKKYNFKSVCYGHAGDGNLHINIIKGDMSDQAWQHELPKGISELFELTVALGGTISGEHGIGYVQRPYIAIALGEKQLELMRGIKRLFDPNGILNPDKIF